MLEYLFQDPFLVAIDKPAGLLVHRSRIDTRATTFAMTQLRDQLGQPVFPIHRLDRPTSGALLFALDPETARRMCRQFETRTIRKRYQAIVRGHPPESGTWDEPLLEKPDRIVDTKASHDKHAQPAVTHFRSLKSWTVPFSAGKYPNSRYALVEVNPETGRKHQIRRHFNHMAYPVVGDTTYGDRRHNRLFRERFGIQRLMLMARELEFFHPYTDAPIRVVASFDQPFNLAIESMNRHNIIDGC